MARVHVLLVGNSQAVKWKSSRLGKKASKSLGSIPSHLNDLSTFRETGHLYAYQKGRYSFQLTKARIKTAAGQKVYGKL